MFHLLHDHIPPQPHVTQIRSSFLHTKQVEQNRSPKPYQQGTVCPTHTTVTTVISPYVAFHCFTRSLYHSRIVTASIE